MTLLLTSSKHDVWAVLTALAVGTVAWQSTALVAGLLAFWTVMGLLAEWHARRTLVALARAAPAGLIIIRQDCSWEQVFRLVWGDDVDSRRRPSRA